MSKVSPRSDQTALRRLGRRVGGLCGLFLGIALACGSEEPADPLPDDETRAAAARYAQAICGAVTGCKCVSPFSSHEVCIETLEERFLAGVRDRRMEVATDCLSATLDRLAEDPCGALEWRLEDGPLCPSLHGAREIGERCSLHPELPLIAANECGGPGSCSIGRCEDPYGSPPRTEPGDACIVEDYLSCVSGQYCGLDSLCHLRGEEGATCEARGCATDLYCKGGIGREPGICSPGEASGAPCDPRDHTPCARDPESRDLRYCHPEEARCTSEPVRICLMITNPHVHPDRSPNPPRPR